MDNALGMHLLQVPVKRQSDNLSNGSSNTKASETYTRTSSNEVHWELEVQNLVDRTFSGNKPQLVSPKRSNQTSILKQNPTAIMNERWMASWKDRVPLED